MFNNDYALRPALVGLGLALGAKSYDGQHKGDGAHEFADSAMKVIKLLDERWK